MDEDTTNTSESRNTRIARLLGWRVEWRNDAYYALIRPDGTEYEGETRDEYVALYASGQHEPSVWQHAPDFVGSCDASLAALPYPHIWHFEPNGNGILVTLIDPKAETSTIRFGKGADYADAASVALEAMLMAQAGGGR